jgi:regulator of protease activity HflC (stomatin/prohibitin superfamily)
MIWLGVMLGFGSIVFLSAARFARPELGQVPTHFGRLLGAIAIVLGLASMITVVPAGHVGVPVVFGKVHDRALTEGLSLVNPFADVQKLSVRTETYTMSSVFSEGPVKGDDSIHALSADGLLMPLDITVAFRLVAGDAPWIYRNLGPDYMDKVIRPAARTSAREAIAGFTAQESYSTRREAVARRMDELLTNRLATLLAQHEDFGARRAFQIEQVMIRNVQLPPKVKEAIEEKLSAEQQALRMQFVLQKERQEAERKRIEAQGIADFQRIVAQGISEPLLAWKGIEATQQLAHSTNTKIVLIGNPKNGMPLIIPTSER